MSALLLMQRKLFSIGFGFFGILVLLAGCSEGVQGPGPREAAVTVFEKYDEWAQGGFEQEDLVALSEMVSPEQYAKLLADSATYSQGEVRQEGAIVVVSSETVSENSGAARVILTLDSSEIKVLAGGEATWRHPDDFVWQVAVTLENREHWIVTGIERIVR